jgi:putative oxidoreductase
MTAPRMTAALALVLRLGLAAVLLIAGALKLRDPAAFATEIANYRLAPALAPHVAATLPAVEVVLAVALAALPLVWRRAAALAATALLATFAAAVASAYLRGIDVACGCFGTGGDPIGGLTLARNVALLSAAVALLALDRGGGGHRPAVSRRTSRRA